MNFTSKKPREYSVLSPAEREEIMIGLIKKKSIRSISRKLGRNQSVISREIKSNSTEDGRYQAFWAQNRSSIRRKKSRIRDRIPDQTTRQYIRDKLKECWSPEQIAGRSKLDIPEHSVSHETIYLYIFKKERDLIQYLLCGRKKRRKRRQKRGKRTMISQRVGIEERPEAINSRIEYGHWEADTAVSKQSKEALMVLQERLLGITYIEKLPRCAPTEMNSAIRKRLECLPPNLRKSITYDNGQENRYHYELREELGIDTYFCHPYSSWEKGSVENAIGLTRRVWPKKTDYALISEEDVTNLEYKLNTRPRKRFGYLSPLEYFLSVALSP